MTGVNRKPGDANYDLYKLALKSTSQRLYPNYVNCSWGADAVGDAYDVKMKEQYLESLSDEEMQKLVDWCEKNPELASAFCLSVVEE
jgi:hypothetical protein